MRFPTPLLIILFVLTVFCDLYILRDIRHYVRRKKVWTWIYAILSLLCMAFLIVIVSMPRRSQESDILPIMWMMYTYLSIYIPKAVYVIFSLLGRIPCLWKGRRFNTGLWLGLPFALLTFIAMWWGVLAGRKEINVNHVDVVSDNIPSSFNGYKIAQFSDAHVGTWGNDTVFISRLVDSINSLKPNLIVFTGDVVNRETSELEPFLTVFRRLHAPDGVISILGNHDYGDYVDWRYPSERQANNELLAVWQRQMGWKLLNNDHTYLVNGSDSIALIGVENWGEPPFKQYGRLEKAYPASPAAPRNLNDGKFKILLSHNPEHWKQEVSKTTDIDLTLSGHTHAMQIMLKIGDWKWSPACFKYQQWGGMYETQNPEGKSVRIYVNIGCGEVGMPFRIGATPEITLFTLHN
ncbi:MAG: metallophosphoesterase [Muribaculaceae bacterium]|nr:metallophosphoesterase [Muribaculaceae bacterium]